MNTGLRLTASLAFTLILGACAATTAPSVGSRSPAGTAASATTVVGPATGAASGSTARPSRTSAGRTGRIEVAAAGFALTLPPGWVEVGLTAADIDALLGEVGDRTVLESLRRQAPTLVAAGVKLWAFDTATVNGSSLQVIVRPGSFAVAALRALAQAGVAGVPGVAPPRVTDVTVGGQPGVRIDYELRRDTGGGTTLTATGTQVYTSANGRLYVFAVTIPQGGRPAAPDEIIGSIAFLR